MQTSATEQSGFTAIKAFERHPILVMFFARNVGVFRQAFCASDIHIEVFSPTFG
jgi:membrane protein DedA with SNARE-associated domain